MAAGRRGYSNGVDRQLPAATDAGFFIERVIEPLPAETMRQHHLADYEKLTREPGFLLRRLLRPVSG